MPQPLVNAVQTLLAEKERLGSRERDLIAALNRVLGGLGCQVVARGASFASPRVTRKKVAVRGRRKPLTCPHCDRRFARAVHLGRHMSASHKAEKKVVALKVVKRKASRRKAKKGTGAKPSKTAVATVKKASRRPGKAKAVVRKAAVKAATEKPTNSGTEGATK